MSLSAFLRRSASTTASARSPLRFLGDASQELTLYQYEICPFCNKIKALLDLLNVPYTTIEVNPLSKSELKGWSVDVGRDLPGDDASAAYARVPVLTRAPQHDQLNDSAAIVACIAEELQRPDATASDAQVRFLLFHYSV